MSNTKPVSRFDWERAIRGPNGPESPTTRHLLLTIGTHVGSQTGAAYPSITTLEKETRYCHRTVVTHLKLAEEAGWYKTERTKLPGMKYPGKVYFIQIPTGSAPRIPAGSPEGGAARIPVPDPGSDQSPSRTSARDDPELVNVLPHTSYLSIGSSKQLTDQDPVSGNLDGTPKPDGKGVRYWAQELGITKAAGEPIAVFEARVALAKKKFEDAKRDAVTAQAPQDESPHEPPPVD